MAIFIVIYRLKLREKERREKAKRDREIAYQEKGEVLRFLEGKRGAEAEGIRWTMNELSPSDQDDHKCIRALYRAINYAKAWTMPKPKKRKR